MQLKIGLIPSTTNILIKIPDIQINSQVRLIFFDINKSNIIQELLLRSISPDSLTVNLPTKILMKKYSYIVLESIALLG